MIDADTRHALDHQRRRRVHWMAQVPPDRREAAKCMDRVDEILDRRIQPRAVESDVVWDEQSSWVIAQALEAPFTPIVDTSASGAITDVYPPAGYSDGAVQA